MDLSFTNKYTAEMQCWTVVIIVAAKQYECDSSNVSGNGDDGDDGGGEKQDCSLVDKHLLPGARFVRCELCMPAEAGELQQHEGRSAVEQGRISC